MKVTKGRMCKAIPLVLRSSAAILLGSFQENLTNVLILVNREDASRHYMYSSILEYTEIPFTVHFIYIMIAIFAINNL